MMDKWMMGYEVDKEVYKAKEKHKNRRLSSNKQCMLKNMYHLPY